MLLASSRYRLGKLRQSAEVSGCASSPRLSVQCRELFCGRLNNGYLLEMAYLLAVLKDTVLLLLGCLALLFPLCHHGDSPSPYKGARRTPKEMCLGLKQDGGALTRELASLVSSNSVLQFTNLIHFITVQFLFSSGHLLLCLRHDWFSSFALHVCCCLGAHGNRKF